MQRISEILEIIVCLSAGRPHPNLLPEGARGGELYAGAPGFRTDLLEASQLRAPAAPHPSPLPEGKGVTGPSRPPFSKTPAVLQDRARCAQ
jgi:hypothetical protein